LRAPPSVSWTTFAVNKRLRLRSSLNGKGIYKRLRRAERDRAGFRHL
jgi:hypothetical protein